MAAWYDGGMEGWICQRTNLHCVYIVTLMKKQLVFFSLGSHEMAAQSCSPADSHHQCLIAEVHLRDLTRSNEAPRPNRSPTSAVSVGASTPAQHSFLFLHSGPSIERSFPLLRLLSLFTDTHIYVWMELEHCGAEGPLMTVKFIYSPLKVLHHGELQYWPSGTGGCAFHVSQSS